MLCDESKNPSFGVLVRKFLISSLQSYFLNKRIENCDLWLSVKRAAGLQTSNSVVIQDFLSTVAEVEVTAKPGEDKFSKFICYAIKFLFFAFIFVVVAR